MLQEVQEQAVKMAVKEVLAVLLVVQMAVEVS